MKFSIVIPTINININKQLDCLLLDLIHQIEKIEHKVEIIVVGKKVNSNQIYKYVRFVSSSFDGRAKNLNYATKLSTGKFLWFVHDDSKFCSDSLNILLKCVNNNPEYLYYFNLKFLKDGSRLNFINQIGANLRSKILGIPFGDQAFCISKENFIKIGIYNEDCSFGEDHLLIWQAKRHNLKIQTTKSTILTSAIKYKKHGWLNLTLKYQFMWIKQAILQIIKRR